MSAAQFLGFDFATGDGRAAAAAGGGMAGGGVKRPAEPLTRATPPGAPLHRPRVEATSFPSSQGGNPNQLGAIAYTSARGNMQPSGSGPAQRGFKAPRTAPPDSWATAWGG